MKRCLWSLVLLVAVLPAQAHELQTAALRLKEFSTGQVDIALKTPLAREGGPVAIVPQFGSGCRPVGEVTAKRETRFILRHWRMRCAGGLAGQRLRIEGLDPRTPDTVVTAQFADGRQLTLPVDRHDPEIRLQPESGVGAPAGLFAYLPIGIEHILFGPDHLLFVLGLMLVVRAAGARLRMLVLALTAFTAAHSLTLASATLGVWGLPPKVVELLIACSIVLLALELTAHEVRRRHGLPPRLTMRKPWRVAFAFGLLHGFGFAGALAEIGLPEAARGWALLLFNVGVELGQLMFVFAVLGALGLLRRLPGVSPAPGWQGAVATLLGGVAMYWTLDRLLIWSTALWVGA